MTLSASDLVDLAAATYKSPPDILVEDIYICLTRLPDGSLVVAPRGSITPEDWARDFIAAPILNFHHLNLGLCHAGFIQGATVALPKVLEAIGKSPVIFTGHSLGGALALGLGALCCVSGITPDQVVTFGAPRVGMLLFQRALAKITSLKQFRRGNDPVPTVPPPLYLDARPPLIAIGKDQIDPFECHHIEGYQTDVKAWSDITPNTPRSYGQAQPNG